MYINVSEYNKMPTTMIHLVIVVDVDDDDPILLTFMNELKWRSDSTRIIIYICAVFGTCISSRTNPLDTGWDWGQK